jgi:hypothetical protein
MAFESEASRLRKLARNPNVLVWWTGHGGVERNKDDVAKIDVHNMLKRCRVTNVEDSEGEQHGGRKEQTSTGVRWSQ